MVMSTKQLKFSIFFILLFALGLGTAAIFNLEQSQTLKKNQLRTLASVKANSTIKMEKHLMPITVQLEGPAEFPEGPGELVTLKGKIRTNFENHGDINYEWILPEDVQVVTGHVSGHFANPVVGQDYEVELTLKDFDRQYRKNITLKARVLNPQGDPLHNSAVITSRPEDSLEYIAPVMMVQAQEFAEKNRMPASASEK